MGGAWDWGWWEMNWAGGMAREEQAGSWGYVTGLGLAGGRGQYWRIREADWWVMV